MSYVKKNENKETIYTIEVPKDVTGIVFNDGSGIETVDIKLGITTGTGYYITGEENGNMTVETYKYK